MKKIKIIFICTICAIMLLSCSKDNTKENNNFPKETAFANNTDEIKPNSVNIDSSTNGIANIISKISTNNIINELKRINKNVIMISVTNQESAKTEYHFINCTDETEISIVNDDKLYDIDRVESHEKSIVLYTRNNHIVVLDNNYKIVDSFDIKGKITESDNSTYCVLPTEKKIVYYITEFDNEGIYGDIRQTDYIQKTSERLKKLECPEKNVGFLNGLYKMYTSYNEEYIYFTGFYLDSCNDGTDGLACYGNICYKNLNIEVTKNMKNNIMTLENSAIYYDDAEVDEEKYSGEFVEIDNKQKITKWNFENKVENKYIYISDNIKHVFSYRYVDYDNKEACKKTYITCYDIDSGKKNKTYLINENIYSLVICEKINSIIYLYYDDNGKCNISMFNM